MRSTFGIFKEIYRGQGIYWSRGTYNMEGNGDYRTLAAAKAAIDRHIDILDAQELTSKQAKAASGNYIVAKRVGDGAVFAYPDGTEERFKTLREARQVVFDRENEHDLELLWL